MYFTNKSNFIHLQKGSLRLKRKIVIDSLSIGTAPFLMNSVGSVIVIIINTRLIKYGGDLDVGAYGIINRIAFRFRYGCHGTQPGNATYCGL